jgi:hypothetical protein
MAGAGLYGFYTSESTKVRAGSLSLLFPGAGLIAVLSIPSILAFVLSTAMIPLVLFAWFGAGGLLFPILLWTGTAGLSVLLAGDSLFELAAPIWTVFCGTAILYITYQTFSANRQAIKKRESRNLYLVQSVRDSQTQAKLPEPGSRELDLETLRFLQWFLELGMTAKDDFSYHDVIDQFQTSAIRYQLYEAVSELGLYQLVYAPNFHGYLSQAMRNIIEKSLTQKVVGFWKWETLWGKFKLDFDPIIDDDIMVSGYVLQAVGIYQSNTGDDRYTRPGSLTFEVDESHKYPYDLKSIADAVYKNWVRGPYCLYSCEPNWIYTMCNLVGISGMTVTDRVLGLNYSNAVKQQFETALEEEFTTKDGTILPIRSELTGFTVSLIPHEWAFTDQYIDSWPRG